MQLIRRVFDFYIFGNLHVALGVSCFVKITLLAFDIKPTSTAFFVFFATILSYNFIRFINIPESKNWMAFWFVENKKILFVASGISAAFCAYFLMDFSFNTLLVLFPFAVITFYYGMKLPGSINSLRRVPGVKIFLIAFCFAGITVLVPLVQNNIEITPIVWILFLQRLLFIILITIPFDIRDIEFDSDTLKTIPQYFGVKTSKLIGVFIGVVVVVIEYLSLNNSGKIAIVTVIISALSVSFLLFSNRRTSRYYCSFWVEAIPVIWFLLLVLFGEY